MKSSYKYVKKWREKNPDKVKLYNKSYIERHKAELSEKRRQRYLRSKQNARSTDPVIVWDPSETESP